MKSLFIMRHAKSSWDSPNLPDFDRPLAGRGEKDAPRMGDFLAGRDLVPDLIVSSPALRAKTTAKRAAKAMGYDDEIVYDERIYAAGVQDLMAVVAGLPNEVESVMLVGHNPGFEELVEWLCGAAARMPTAAIAYVAIDAENWFEVGENSGVLEWLITPKLLD
ncbi:MAG: histidine phosphatase family protein [Caldilineales bacterium]|nr:histidine phosphatase family protein [Caldilineales bacterium]